MSYIVHCLRRGTSKLAGNCRVVRTAEEAEDIRRDWLKQGAIEVDVRSVDNSRDWNDQSDPEVQRTIQEERDEIEGRW